MMPLAEPESRRAARRRAGREGRMDRGRRARSRHHCRGGNDAVPPPWKPRPLWRGRSRISRTCLTRAAASPASPASTRSRRTASAANAAYRQPLEALTWLQSILRGYDPNTGWPPDDSTGVNWDPDTDIPGQFGRGGFRSAPRLTAPASGPPPGISLSDGSADGGTFDPRTSSAFRGPRWGGGPPRDFNMNDVPPTNAPLRPGASPAIRPGGYGPATDAVACWRRRRTVQSTRGIPAQPL